MNSNLRMKSKTLAALAFLGLMSSSFLSAAPAQAAVPTIATWTSLDGTNVTITNQGTPVTAQVTLGGTLPHAYENAGIGAENKQKYQFSPFNIAGMNYELYKVGDYVQADFSDSGTTDIKLLLGWINLGDEILVSASTDGTNFAPVDLSDTSNVSAAAISSNTLASVTNGSPGVYAPGMVTATAYGGSYQIHFATAIKSIRVENLPILAGSDSTPSNGVGFLLPGELFFKILAASNDSAKGSATSTDLNSDGVWDLVATANQGFRFKNWTCTDRQTPASTSLATTTLDQGGETPNHNATCTANFEIDPAAPVITPAPPVITPAANDAARGSVTATDANADGTWDLVATANAGYVFAGWTCTASQSPASASSATTTVTPSQNSTCTANFDVVQTLGGKVLKASKTLSDFAGNSAVLTKSIKAKIRKFIAANPTINVFTCTGFRAGNTMRPFDIALAKKRAANVCGYIKKLQPDAVTKIKAKITALPVSGASRKVYVSGQSVQG